MHQARRIVERQHNVSFSRPTQNPVQDLGKVDRPIVLGYRL